MELSKQNIWIQIILLMNLKTFEIMSVHKALNLMSVYKAYLLSWQYVIVDSNV
jgi:hypothetical protein